MCEHSAALRPWFPIVTAGSDSRRTAGMAWFPDGLLDCLPDIQADKTMVPADRGFRHTDAGGGPATQAGRLHLHLS